MFNLKKCMALVIAVTLALPAAATELVMVEEDGCVWCALWDSEIAPAYPNTSEGRFAPLRRVDIDALPDDLIVVRRVGFTPTFLIVENGREVARIEGYPGADFFWPVLANLLTQHTNYLEENG